MLPAPSTRGKRIKLVALLRLNPIEPDARSTVEAQTVETQAAPRDRSSRSCSSHTAIEVDWLLAETGGTPADLEFLEAKGLIEFRYREVLRDPLADKIFAPAEPPVLTQDQSRAWNEIQPGI